MALARANARRAFMHFAGSNLVKAVSAWEEYAEHQRTMRGALRRLLHHLGRMRELKTYKINNSQRQITLSKAPRNDSPIGKHFGLCNGQVCCFFNSHK